MRSGSIFTLLVVAGLCVSNTNGQDMGLYSGRGIPDSFNSAPEVKKSRWPKLLDFSKDEVETPKQKPFSRLFAPKMPFEGSNNSRSFETTEEPKTRRGLSTLFAKRDPNRPGVFEQLNSKSKNFFDRTSGWAKRTNQGIREKTFGTWDAITRRSRDNGESSRPASPAQPPIRTTDHLKPTGVRY